MIDIILLIGMPGSGKTFFGNKLSNELNIPFLDDLKDINLLKPFLIDKKSVIVADPLLCFPKIYESATTMIKQHNCNSVCYFWENNYEQCLKNVQYRNDGRKVDILLKQLKMIYNSSDNAMKVWRNE